MARLIESIVLSVILSVVAIVVVNNFDQINYALNQDNINPLADKPSYDASEIEQKVHGFVNQERIKAGLAPLDWDSALNAIAREHSKDMAQRNFFDHVNPEGETPTERGLAQGYNCTKYFDTHLKSGLAENIHQNNLYTTYDYRGDVIISYNWSSVDAIAQKTVGDWMESPNHRKNILDPELESEGIGVYIDKNHKVWITENFC